MRRIHLALRRVRPPFFDEPLGFGDLFRGHFFGHDLYLSGGVRSARTIGDPPPRICLDRVPFRRAHPAESAGRDQSARGVARASATMGGRREGKGAYLPYAREVKQKGDVMTMAVKLIHRPEHAEDILQDGSAGISKRRRATLNCSASSPDLETLRSVA